MKQNAMPLYKYVSPDRVDVLQDGRIRFSQASALNDPIESSPVFDTITDLSDVPAIGEQGRFKVHERLATGSGKYSVQSHVFEPAKSNEEFIRFAEYIRGFQKRISIAVGESIGVLSLSESKDNLLMWAHYAQRHEGFVIEFDETHSFFSAKDDSGFGILLPVNYSMSRPARTSMTDLTREEFFLTKGEDWKYEREWRVLRLLSEADYTIPTPNGNVYLFSLPASCVSGIILGCRSHDDIKAGICSLVTNDDRYRHVNVLQATVDPRQYGLNVATMDRIA